LRLGYINIKTSILPFYRVFGAVAWELVFFHIGDCLSIRGLSQKSKKFKKFKIFKKIKMAIFHLPQFEHEPFY